MIDELSRIPENAPAWLANWIGRTDQRLQNNEAAMTRLSDGQTKITENLGRMSEKLDLLLGRMPPVGTPLTLSSPVPKNGISHKWLTEKLWLPILIGGLMVLLGIVVAHLVAG